MKTYRLWNIFCHGSIVMSIVFLVLFIIDRVNPSMEFIGSEQGDWLLLLFCLLALTNGVITAARLSKAERCALKREADAPEAPYDRER